MILIVKDNSDDPYCKRQQWWFLLWKTTVMILIVKDNSDDSYCKRQ